MWENDSEKPWYVPSTRQVDNIKTVWSAALAVFGIIVMTDATLGKHNLFWPSVPPYIQIPFLVLDILLLGTLEGIQISLVALKNHNSEAFKHTHPRAYRANVLCQKDGNLEKFLMGRQVFVIITVFFGSYITTQSADFDNLLGWEFPSWVGAAFFQTGLMGVLVIAVFAQLMVQVVASSYPINFMQAVPFAHPVLVGCLIFENLGIVYLCYTIADIFMRVTGMKRPDDHTSPRLRKRGFSHLFHHNFNPNPTTHMTRVGSHSASNIRHLSTHQPGADIFESFSEEHPLENKLCDVLSTLEVTRETDNEIMKEAMRKYPQLFNNFPCLIGSKVYASPQQVQQYIKDTGYRAGIPDFLLPTNAENHMPPHIYSTRLLMEQHALVQAAIAAGLKPGRDFECEEADLLAAFSGIDSK